MSINFFLFIIHWIITTLLWIFVWIPFYILGFFVTWIGLLFTNKNSEHLPLLWWPWDNNHGINGTLSTSDNAINNPKWVILCNKLSINENTEKQIFDIVKLRIGKERTFLNRWIWCTWRNPVTNLSLYFLGSLVIKPIQCFRYTKGRFSFEKYICNYLWYYGFSLQYSTTKRFYYGFGWKFADLSENRARFVYRISPCRNI